MGENKGNREKEKQRRLTIEKCVNDELAVPLNQVVDITKDSTKRSKSASFFFLLLLFSLLLHTANWKPGGEGKPAPIVAHIPHDEEFTKERK